MREYENKDYDTKKTGKIFCNQCGRAIRVENGVIKEGIFSAEVSFGYFSQKDGVRHQFDLCEECYDRMVRGFRIPVTRQEETELC